MWCWVSIDWNFLRVAVFYGPMWVVIAITLTIYIRVGKQILEKRQQMQNARSDVDNRRLSVVQNAFIIPGVTKTTEVTVHYEANPSWNGIAAAIPTNEEFDRQAPLDASYSISVQGGTPKKTAHSRANSFKRNVLRRIQANQTNKAARSYFKCALLFFVALLITWIPSSINRVYELVYPDRVSYGLSLTASLVLPLQGFWNSAVYIATSREACKLLVERIKEAPALGRNRSSTSSQCTDKPPKDANTGSTA